MSPVCKGAVNILFLTKNSCSHSLFDFIPIITIVKNDCSAENKPFNSIFSHYDYEVAVRKLPSLSPYRSREIEARQERGL